MQLGDQMENQGKLLFKHRGVLPIFVLVVGTYLYIHTELYPETFF